MDEEIKGNSCGHGIEYRCQRCGVCYACGHKQVYIKPYYWWVCHDGMLCRTNTRGEVIQVLYGKDNKKRRI